MENTQWKVGINQQNKAYLTNSKVDKNGNVLADPLESKRKWPISLFQSFNFPTKDG